MSFDFPALSKEKILLVVSMVAIFAAVGIGNYLFKDVPEDGGIVLKVEPGLTLKGKGALPPLHEVIAMDENLAAMVKNLGAIPATELFTRQADIDQAIVSLLFRWAGADLAEQGSYGPYIDSRVVSFLKTIGSIPETVLPGTQIEMTEAGSLNQLWFTVFEHFRIRLLIQLSGKDVYGGQASYDPDSERISVTAPVSPDFIDAFQAELKVSDNSGEAMRALLDFIDATKGFTALNDAEQDMIMSLNAAEASSVPAENIDAAPAPATTP